MQLNLKKSDSHSYKTIVESIGFKPEEILYIDDNEAYIDAAKTAGMTTILYKSNEQTIQGITSLSKPH